ncbi:ribonuclease H-like domain-containing protein [Tanacetum coccineum]
MEEEKNVENTRPIDKSVVETSESNKEEPPRGVDVKDKVERKADDKPAKSAKEEVTKNKEEEPAGVSSSHTVGYYLKHRINEKLIEGLIIGGLKNMNALVDQGSDVNVIPLSIYNKLTDERPAETDIRLSLASHSYIYPLGITEDVLVDVVGYVYPMDFVILDIKENKKRPFILETPFLTTAKAVIKFDKGTITLRSGKSKISFHRIPEPHYRVEKGIKNDIEPIAPTMTVNRLVLEWEEKIKLHQEKEVKFDQWRSKTFNNERPALVEEKCKLEDEGGVTIFPDGIMSPGSGVGYFISIKLENGVLPSSGYGVLDLVSFVVFGKKADLLEDKQIPSVGYLKRLGHPSDQVVDVLQHDLNFTKDSQVSPCDICPHKVISKDGYIYFLTIVDDYTRVVWVYLVNIKDEVYDLFVSFVNLIPNQFKCNIKTVRSNNGTEFVNNKMHYLFNSFGIVHQTTCAYTPQQNGIAKRKHIHLLYAARSLLFQSGIPLNMWTECILTAVYLINMLPFSVLNVKSLFELVYGFKPKLSHLRSFGYLCFSSILNNSNNPNDDGRGSVTPNDDGNVHPYTKSYNTFDDSEDDFATSMRDNSNSEGNVPTYFGLNTQRNLPENSSLVQPDIKKSSRYVKMLAKFNDYVVGSSRKYGLEKYLFQLDINNALLYGDLSEDAYMTLPPIFNSEKSKSKFDYSLFTKNYDDMFIALLVYVDDIVITENNLPKIEKFKFQRKYCLEILHEYGLLAAKYIDTPLSENTTINHVESDDDHLLSNVGNYQRLVGKLIYLTNIRPGISYVVHCLSQFMHVPLESHLDDVLRVLRYLKGSLATRKSVSGSMASATCEVIWLSNLLGDMGVKGLLHVVLYCDNSSALQIAANHEKSKHFEIDVHLALDIEQHKALCEKLGTDSANCLFFL